MIADASENSAVVFDVIFEAGLGLDLPMDELNAKAGSLNEQYLAEGMAVDEAVRAVSTDLLEDDVYIAACQAAYGACPDFLISSAAANEICP